MEDKNNDADKLDEVMLPGFRFHPTDEELVGFYLKRKIQQRPLSIELIKQLDIYKYDPWDLPKLATTGEKEWYFYCPRDRKYRNSARPNRVTGAGFWKATGTDRPIYSSEGTKCIGLKKSLVFYKGRAAKGVKTDWMMHEFRLPSLTDSVPPKRLMDKSIIPANDSWAICRIFKKTNSTAQRALSHSWVSSLPETNACDLLPKCSSRNTQFSSDQNMSFTVPKTTSSVPFQFCSNNDIQNSSSNTVSPTDFFSYKPYQLPISNGDFTPNFIFSPLETSSAPSKSTVDVSSMLLNMPSSMLGDFGIKASESIGFSGSQQEQCTGFSIALPQEQVSAGNVSENALFKNLNMNVADTEDHWEAGRTNIGFPFGLPLPLNTVIGDAWKPNLLWDSSPCPSEMSTTSFFTTKCYT
ncbi:hypothetical protein FEM48_Zijuj10G0081300 [Ziziphus jujuba var. spinosa]|uniref:NAC domain-containing protein n=1 Tax=Ziziphus jujuba var. spinosa TaxID=714518 RepID=A0A978UM85_ZIZJJ|nr:hypothetical protein FEM48_Zijuj10G0081300 [Ziziphus jujuba var. spinosa]